MDHNKLEAARLYPVRCLATILCYHLACRGSRVAAHELLDRMQECVYIMLKTMVLPVHSL